MLSSRNTLAIALAILFSAGVAAQSPKTPDEKDEYQARRELMVRQQIEARGVSDERVLKAMREVPRHLFVPESHRKYAYADHPLPIGEEQTISQPYIVALMTELLKLDSSDRVLEIGTGSGYQAAVLAELCDSVFTIEIIPSLAERADKTLSELRYDNVVVRCGDGYIGWEEHAPFNAIIVTCAPPTIPQPLLDQLAEGGRMVVPVGTEWQELTLISKVDGKIHEEKIIPVIFVPMTGKAQEKQ